MKTKIENTPEVVPGADSSPSPVRKLPPDIEIELLKARLVVAVFELQRLSIWALSSPLADLKNKPPVGYDMSILPPDIQARVIKARESWDPVSFPSDKSDSR